MLKVADIYFLQNDQIDKKQWDKCINTSLHGLIYARSFYLDNICPGWKALTGDNYGWVLPITNRTKFGISYLYQPPFTQQSGVFAKPGVVVPYKEILQWLQQHYRFWEINWNYATDTNFITSPVNITPATNFVLNLSAGYDRIALNFHKDLIKNLNRSKRFQLKYRPTNDYNKGIELFKKHYANRVSHVKEDDYKKFSNICSYSLNNQMFIGREVFSDKNEFLAMALILNDGKRLYNLMNITTEAGRQAEANHFLLDAILREFSGNELLFDFEGSDLPGVKAFYKNFGAINQPYYMLTYNNLPALVKLFKK